MPKKPIFEKNAQLRDVAIKLAKLGLYQKTVADWVGVDEDTITAHKKRDLEFREAFENGPATARALCLAKLIEKVGEGNIQAIKYYLSTICGFNEYQGSAIAITPQAPTVILEMPDNGRRAKIEAPAGATKRVSKDKG